MNCGSCLQFTGCAWSGSACYFSPVPCNGSNCVVSCTTNPQQTCTAADCVTCVSISNCQWAMATRTCFYSATPCGGNACATTQSQCASLSPCSAITTCLACAAAASNGCFWYQNRCIQIPCTGTACTQLGYTSQCPQPTCVFNNCVDCLNTIGCQWAANQCVTAASGYCGQGNCVTSLHLCPQYGCAYGQVWSPSSNTCMATSCAATNACPQNYTCQTQTSCGAPLCPVVCTAPAPQCGLNEQWTNCASSTCFEAVCFETNYATRVCAQDCRKGCQCMQGYSRWEGSCVSNCPRSP